MPKLKALPHLHTYKRVHLGAAKTPVYRCIEAGCGHYIDPELLMGRKARCPICKEEYILVYRDKLRRTPHCSSCRMRSDAMAVKNNELRDKLKEEYKLLMKGVKK